MKINKYIYVCLVFVIIGFTIPKTAFCELKALEDMEMSDVYAEGFSSFSLEPSPAASLRPSPSLTSIPINIPPLIR